MKINHPSLGFLLRDISGDYPNLNEDTLSAAADHVDQAAFHVCEVGTLEEVQRTLDYFNRTLAHNPTPEVKAIFLVGVEWAELWIGILQGEERLQLWALSTAARE